MSNWIDGSQYIKCVGSSYDKRTNAWRITCPKCGKDFNPPTTMLNFQQVECPKSKCKAMFTIDYNDKKIRFIDEE